MIAFLDFEASSLADDGYPIEVAWVFEDGRAETHLIAPLSTWTDWDPRAEAIHGLSRQTLQAEGAPPHEVAARMLAELGGHDLYATAPSWDGKWLSVLLRAGGFPRHALRLRDSDEAHIQAMTSGLRTDGPALLERLRGQFGGSPAHRALPDARVELQIWEEIKRLGQAAPGSSSSS